MLYLHIIIYCTLEDVVVVVVVVWPFRTVSERLGDHIKVTCHICMGAKGWDGTKSILVVYILGMSPQ